MISPAEVAGGRRPGIVYAKPEEESSLERYPDDLPLPKRLEEVPSGFFLSPHQVDLVLTMEDPEPWRISGLQETSLRDLQLRENANAEARRKAFIENRRAVKKARQLRLWRRDYELMLLKRARPDWFRDGLNAHNLALRRQKMDLIKRVAGYLAELCGPDGYECMEDHYPAAKRAVFGTETPYKSPRKIKDLWVQVSTLCRDFITARTAAKEDAEKAAEIALSGEASPPPSHVRLPKRHKGKSIQRTIASRTSELAGYSSCRAPSKPDVSKGSESVRAVPETLPVPEAPGASRGPRNIAWLPARLLPHKIVGLAVANLHQLEFRHGRHGCTVAWDRRHALNFLASGLAGGRPLSGLVAAYKAALGREDYGTHVPGMSKRTPGRVIARARRAAYRMGIVSPWALDAYRERRDAKREGRERCREFEAAVVATAVDENAAQIAAAKAAVNSWDFDERARARRFLDGLGIAY